MFHLLKWKYLYILSPCPLSPTLQHSFCLPPLLVCMTNAGAKECNTNTKTAMKAAFYIFAMYVFHFHIYIRFVCVLDLLYALKPAIDLYDGKYTYYAHKINNVNGKTSGSTHSHSDSLTITATHNTKHSQNYGACINDIFIHRTIYLFSIRIAS